MKYTFVVKDLRCEYLANPLGIDEKRPMLSWMLESNKRGQLQTAYQIIVSSSLKLLDKNNADIWDSGKVLTDQSTHIEYGGVELKPRMQYFWKIRVWDKDNEVSSYSAPAFWEMGLMDSTDYNDPTPKNNEWKPMIEIFK